MKVCAMWKYVQPFTIPGFRYTQLLFVYRVPKVAHKYFRKILY